MSDPKELIKKKENNSFVIRGSRNLSQRKDFLLNNEFLKYKLDEKALDDLLIARSKNIPIILEIGFGNGEFMFSHAANNTESIYVGVEVFEEGIIKLLSALNLHEKEVSNLYIYQGDAIYLLKNLIADNFFSEIRVFFPDPWPKKRHHKRRIIRSEFLDLFHQKLCEKGVLRIATDHADYAEWIINQFAIRDDYIWLANSFRDWTQEPDDWVSTKYQRKALSKDQQHRIYFDKFQKVRG